MIPFHWRPDHVAGISTELSPVAPVIARTAVCDVLPGHDVWDHWPVLTMDGALATIAGGLLVMALVAPRMPDPEDRHAVARIWLLHRTDSGWRDLGPLFPDDDAPGSRQWSGSAVLTGRGDSVRLFFTAVGERGERIPSVTQRLFEAIAPLHIIDGVPFLGAWSGLRECARPDGLNYETDMAGGGAIGTIKAFRDPFFFRDHGGEDWLLFTASAAGAASPWNGVIGAARWTKDGWRLQPAIVSAAGLNNELERPHVICHRGAVYLFWSTQAKVFVSSGPRGPTGLYGLVADRWGAPWRPINGSGLVLANPAATPIQAYSFQLLPDLSLWSFADMPGARSAPLDAAARRATFAGGPAPVLRLALDGDCATLAPR
ncbi:glycoside hydrolase family 68 protein [Sphingomonas sp. 28-63-12]|uniref:glycoside hydrolase family 68 protein n=1 Tax=Sphingomonas sp. 28-63-12 TaxID=1970434 RepID=UPI000BD8BBD4|nr:MAG: glycoside hydrolase 68 family protein [Sphingomonas sp. 28-63-12]